MNIKLGIKTHQIKLMVYCLTAGIFAVSFFLSFSFLYNNFYLVMTESSEIMSLQKNIPMETINLNDFEKVIERIDSKSSVKNEELKELKNPFD